MIMRRFLLALLTFISVGVSAQILRTATFDFTNPHTLDPEVIPSDVPGSSVCIDGREGKNYVFTDKQISISFRHNDGTGARIATELNGKYNLGIGFGCEIIFTAEKDVEIKTLRFSSDCFMGGLRLPYGQPGTFDYPSIWRCNDGEKVNQLTFKDTSVNAEIRSIIIEYTTPADVLEPEANIKDNETLPSFKEMTLTFKSDMDLVKDALPIIIEGAEGFSKVMTPSISKNNKNIVILSLAEEDGAIETDGTYTITVPACCFVDGEGMQNKELKYTFQVKVPENPFLEKARNLLEFAGLGYPTANSAARDGLKTLVDEESKDEEKLKAAIDAFYAETDIELPSDGKYYIISGVNENGDAVYLTYGNGKVTLTADKTWATHFAVETKVNNTFAFKTADGKYLQVLVNGNDNVTAEYNAAVNNLTLAKLDVEGVEAEKMFGMMTVYGALDEEAATNVFVVISHNNNTVVTDASKYAAPEFTSDLSSAFVLEETEQETLESAEVNADLTPDVVAYNTEKLTLRFKNVLNVVMSGNKTMYFKNKADEKVGDATVTFVDNTTFTVSLDGMADGKYTLVVPEGMFVTVKNGKKVNVAAFEKAFTIDGSEAEDFTNKTFQFAIYNDNKEYWFDTDLNDYCIVSYDAPMYADPTKALRLVDRWHVDDVIRVAHLKRVTKEDLPESYVYQIVFDTPIERGDLRTGVYNIIMEEGTIGDENFHDFLEDHTSVKKADCKVNERYVFAFNVDNNKATAITDVNAADNADKTIYTITGRRVENMNAPGIYIINGKKVVKK